MNKEKYINANAKVIALNEEGYLIGFECPKCDSGYVTKQYKHEGEEPLKIGDIIPVKISAIKMQDGEIIEVELFDATSKISYMPTLVEEARELGILDEKTIEEPPAQPKYTITESIGNGLYKLQSDDEEKQFMVGITKKELEINTLANEDDFDKIVQEHPMADYTLIHHWWENGKYEHWDLFINDGENLSHFVLEHNPLKETEIKAAQRQPYSDDFWMKGSEVETILPGKPGNPSKLKDCHVERLDMGKVAIYESAPQPNESFLLRVEFFGSTLEGRWSFSSTVPNIWHALKETVKLTEEFPIDICLTGQLEWEETAEGLKVFGTALSFGVWNGFYWAPEVIQNSPLGDFDSMIIDVEHENDKVAGAVLENNLEGYDVRVEGLVKDYETIEKIKNGEYKGFSIDATVFADPVRRMVTGVKAYKRLTICRNPACKVCYFGM